LHNDDDAVGVIEKLGANVTGYDLGQRVITGAICPNGFSNTCFEGVHSQGGQSETHGLKPLGGWRFGNTIDDTQAEYVPVPDAIGADVVIEALGIQQRFESCPMPRGPKVPMDVVTERLEAGAGRGDGWAVPGTRELIGGGPGRRR
jgi:Alcohol dehydrogenase GroES-like domain